METRVKGKAVDVDYGDIERFFAERSDRDGVKSKYNYVLFQDDNPELAEQRDAWEKEKIAPFLNVAQGKKTLDLGCGIGRWGEFFLPQGVRYVGMDGSAGMVRRGEENLKEYTDKHLFQGYLQDFPTRLSEEGEEGSFDNILVNGVFMYLNDVDFHASLTNLLRYAAPSWHDLSEREHGDRGALDASTGAVGGIESGVQCGVSLRCGIHKGVLQGVVSRL